MEDIYQSLSILQTNNSSRSTLDNLYKTYDKLNPHPTAASVLICFIRNSKNQVQLHNPIAGISYHYYSTYICGTYEQFKYK